MWQSRWSFQSPVRGWSQHRGGRGWSVLNSWSTGTKTDSISRCRGVALTRLKSRLNAPVCSMVRIEVSHQGFNAIEALELALAGLAHGGDGLIVGDQGLKGQRLVAGNTGQHEPEGIGHGEADRRQDGSCFVLDVLVDTSPDNGIGRHDSPLGHIVAQIVGLARVSLRNAGGPRIAASGPGRGRTPP